MSLLPITADAATADAAVQTMPPPGILAEVPVSPIPGIVAEVVVPLLASLPPSGASDRLIVAGLAGLAALAIGSLRRAPSRHWLVITRRGRVRRVITFGCAIRIPGLDECRVLPRDAQHLPIGVAALTRDGVPVQLLVTAVLRVTDPVATGADPIGTTLAEVHDLLRRLLADHDVDDVLRVRTAIERSMWEIEHGIEVEAVTVDAIDVEVIGPHAKYRSQT